MIWRYWNNRYVNSNNRSKKYQMNILYCTQASSLPMFYALNGALTKKREVDRVGFTLSDSSIYKKWLDERVEFESEEYYLLKEWEVTDQRTRKITSELLAEMEARIGGEAGLFGAIIADRRLFMGQDCTYTQDYSRRFTDDELYSILATAVESVESLFDRMKPDLVVSFICVTILDYVAYLVARSRGVQVLNLRPTRISDRVAFSMFLNDPSPELASSYERLSENGASEYREIAIDYIKRVREQHGRYEGVIKASDRPALKSSIMRYLSLAAIKKSWKNFIQYNRSPAKKDNHVPNPVRYVFYSSILNPLRAKLIRNKFQGAYVDETTLKRKKYVFFPLHTEPEVSLLVYGRPYVNQIEVIRMIAMSLPLDMVLVVKEHPWMVGKRSMSAYRKLLNIPKVVFVSPKCEARRLIQDAALITVITGSVALEAAMLGKPVITFGDCPYNLLPNNMIRRCNDPRYMQTMIREMLENYCNDEVALENYVAAVYESSVSANLYSVLLGKNNVHKERNADYAKEIEKLASYSNKMIGSIPKTQRLNANVAKW